MLNSLQHTLLKLAEEGAEIAQIASKTMQFGPSEVMPGQPLNNFERTHLEIDDLFAVVELLNEHHGFGYAPNRERIEAKKAKIATYRAFSVALGLAEGNVACAVHPMAQSATHAVNAVRPACAMCNHFFGRIGECGLDGDCEQPGQTAGQKGGAS